MLSCFYLRLLSTGRPISSFIYKIHREKYKLHRENTGNLNWKREWEPCRRLNLFIGDMYNRYKCPLQLCRHLTLKFLIQGHPPSAKVPHIADFKSPLLLVLEVCSVKPIHRKSGAANLLMWSDLNVDHSFKVKQGYPN